MIDDVRMTFLALREAPTPSSGDLLVRRLDPQPEVYLGIDMDSRHHLLIRHDGDDPEVGVVTLQIGHRDLTVGGRLARFLDIECRLDALEEVFDHFVLAVVHQLGTGTGSPARAVETVLERWQLFLSAGGPPPSADKLASLLGELLVLLDLVRADDQRRVDAWRGPYGSRHDFRRGGCAVEVKVTLAHTSRVVTIHGEDQLEAPGDGTLLLHFIRLERSDRSGRSVSDVIDELLALGAPAEQLFGALSNAGLTVAQLAHASGIGFDIRERLTFPVTDAVPRIVPASFTDGARPLGVVDLQYKVDLDHALRKALDATQYKEIVDRMCAGGSDV